ncbi:DUF7511 domain-containing protein [Haloplanus natans]|uniref:DUF7511 domain-containing protein n=1 Tax=Haloplanus natans TaxID=376171 RepID=UPI000677D55F|nr:hypothetical protein [Haloplanus natans]
MSSVDEGGGLLDSPALDRWPTYTLEHTVEAVGSDGEQCTIYPPTVDDDEQLTAWITADCDAFVAIDEIR